MLVSQRQRFLRGTLAGFLLGVACTCSVWNIHQTDTQLRAFNILNDHATGMVPPHVPTTKCDDVEGTTTDKLNGSQKLKVPSPGSTAQKESRTNVDTNIIPEQKEPIDKTTNPESPAKEVLKRIVDTHAIVEHSDTTVVEDDGVEYLKYKPIIVNNAKGVPIHYNRTRYIIGKGVKEFDPDVPVVIATKIHDSITAEAVEQSLCLLTRAYNYRTNYDIVVFSSLPWTEEQLEPIRKAVAPAKFSLVVDNPGLQTMVDALTPNQTAHLLERCNVSSSAELNWYTRCLEQSSTYVTYERLNYNWQAEFRAKHLWRHPALAKYKYMLWLDSDGFCSHVWQQDPIATMIRNDLVLLFDHFPQGTGRGYEWPYRMKEAFGKVICGIDMKNGTLFAWEGGCLGKNSRIKQLHGFFHVTDLDFYRSPPVLKWADVLIGDSKFSRMYDDQIGVTVPAAVLAGNRSWDMQSHGIYLDVVHNFLLDGLPARRTGGYQKWWNSFGNATFPEAWGQCRITQKG